MSTHEPITIPRGTIVQSMNPRHGEARILKRAQTVTPHFVDRYDERTVVTWAGTGGYWQRASLIGGEWVSGVLFDKPGENE